jgi:hypothetical protein
MNGVWLQDAGKHLHDHDVVLDHITRPDGSVEVTLGSGVRSSWSTLTLTFTHDGSGATKVAAITKSRPDVHRDGLLPAREEQALDGRVLVHTNDWGPGKDISCMFALNGMSGKQPMLLMGSFLVMLPK